MAITTNIELIERNLSRFGIDIPKVRDILLSGGTGFVISYNHLDNADSICQKVRTVLYSWLTILNVKDMYTISAKHKAIQVSKKINITGITIPLKVAWTNPANKRSGRITQVYSEDVNKASTMEASTMEASTMPDQDAIESAARIDAALEMPEDNYYEPPPVAKSKPDSLPTTKHNSVFNHVATTEQKAKQDAEQARAGSNLQEIDNGKEI